MKLHRKDNNHNTQSAKEEEYNCDTHIASCSDKLIFCQKGTATENNGTVSRETAGVLNGFYPFIIAHSTEKLILFGLLTH